MESRWRCRGPLVVPEEEQRRHFARLRAGADPADLVGEMRALRSLHGIPDEQAPPADYTLRTLRARRGCGFDLTPLVLRLPADGEERRIACPACGNVVAFTRHP